MCTIQTNRTQTILTVILYVQNRQFSPSCCVCRIQTNRTQTILTVMVCVYRIQTNRTQTILTVMLCVYRIQTNITQTILTVMLCVQNTDKQNTDNSHRPCPTVKCQTWYYFGERSAHVIHCRLRLEMSNHNNDLVNRHLSADPKCSCGYSKETAEHYLLHCPNYSNIRARTILTLPSGQTDIRTLLYGNLDLRLPKKKETKS